MYRWYRFTVEHYRSEHYCFVLNLIMNMNQYGILMCRDLLNGFCTINQSLGWAQFSLAQFSIIRVQLSLQLDSTILKFYNAIYPFAFDVDNLLVKFCHLTHKFNEQIISTKVKGKNVKRILKLKETEKLTKTEIERERWSERESPSFQLKAIFWNCTM